MTAVLLPHVMVAACGAVAVGLLPRRYIRLVRAEALGPMAMKKVGLSTHGLTRVVGA